MSDTPNPAAAGADAAPAKPEWRRRWLIIRLVLGFCALIIGYATVLGADDRLRETALLGAFGLAGAVALGFIGFAVQDDRNWMTILSTRAAGGKTSG